ncbi:MAG: alkaline phosphatase family protein [Anaerolineae bacterium]|nr:alkaline phosphatase family protein [Anaerolineae bacterium]MDW8103088.1 alkaline phosphatase family protein [Anaerolineae bacterium]
MARIVKILLLALILLILAGAGYFSQKLALIGWDSVVEYRSQYLAPLPRGNSSEPLALRAILIIVDGLRLDVSRKLPNLNELRKEGADLVVRTGQPSLSYPAWTVLASGTWQEISGVTTNWYKGPVQADNLFKVTKDSGLPSVAVGSPGWKKLFGPYLTEALIVEEPPEEAPPEEWARVDEETYRLASEALDKYSSGLIFIHFVGTDAMGHNYGGVSREFLDEALRVDGFIGKLVQKLDPDKDVLLITSDHGHIDRGGHGGWENEVIKVPLVIKGKAVRKGLYSEQTQADIAPTIAALLGIPYPVHSQGRPLMELIEASAEVKGRKSLNAALQLAGFYDSYARALGSSPFAGDILSKYRERLASGEEGALEQFYREVSARAASIKAATLWKERLFRLPLTLLLAFVPLLYLLNYRKRLRDLLVPLAFALLYFAFYNALFFGRGHNWSLSAFNTEAQIKAFFNERLLDAALSFVVAGLLLAIVSWRRPAFETFERVVSFGFFTGYWLLLQVLIFYWLYNYFFSWYVPDLRLGFKYYLDLLQMVPVGFISIILAPVAVLIGLGMKRWRKIPAGGGG